MYYSGLQVFSFVVLLVGTGLIIASIPTPNWTHQIFSKAGDYEFSADRGLYQQCQNYPELIENTKDFFNSLFNDGGDKAGKRVCTNRFEAFQKEGTFDNLKNAFKAWEVACLALMVGSALLGLLALILSPCCCRRCGFCLVITVLLATLCCAAGVGTFAYYSKAEPTASTTAVVTVDKAILEWSFWLAVAGGGCQLIATILFGISSCRHDGSYSHTI